MKFITLLFTALLSINSFAQVSPMLDDNLLIMSDYSAETINPFNYGLKLKSTKVLSLDSKFIDVYGFIYVGTFPFEPINATLFLAHEQNICKKDRTIFIFNRETNRIYSLFWTSPKFKNINLRSINECMFMHVNEGLYNN